VGSVREPGSRPPTPLQSFGTRLRASYPLHTRCVQQVPPLEIRTVLTEIRTVLTGVADVFPLTLPGERGSPVPLLCQRYTPFRKNICHTLG
jgi:hypothetical protein